MKLTKKTILITGGTSGIGLELARQLIERGNTVIVTGRDAGRLDQLRQTVPHAHQFQSDVSDPLAISALHASVLRAFPALDVLINNAGIMRNLDLNMDQDIVGVTREIDVNLNGPIRMIQQFLPHLKTRPHALILNVSSGLAYVPLPASPVYSAAKAGLHAYTRSLRVQLRQSRISVVELLPPAVETPLLTAFAKEMKGQNKMDVAVLANKAIQGIEAGRMEIRPGLSRMLMVMSRVAPNFALEKMVKALAPAH